MTFGRASKIAPSILSTDVAGFVRERVALEAQGAE